MVALLTTSVLSNYLSFSFPLVNSSLSYKHIQIFHISTLQIINVSLFIIEIPPLSTICDSLLPIVVVIILYNCRLYYAMWFLPCSEYTIRTVFIYSSQSSTLLQSVWVLTLCKMFYCLIVRIFYNVSTFSSLRVSNPLRFLCTVDFHYTLGPILRP